MTFRSYPGFPRVVRTIPARPLSVRGGGCSTQSTMKYTPTKAFATAVLFVAFCGAAQVASAQTSGYTKYTNTYSVQNRTNGCGGYSGSSSGTFTAWVCAGEERVEMRWANWPNQNTYNQWQGEINFTSGTQKTCIMQIKSNTGGEPIYIQVQNPGTLRNDNGSVFMSSMSGKWFRLNALFNPANGDSRAYINGSQKVSRSYPTSDRQWYFKNGTYNNGLPSGGKSQASFRNISHWRR